VVSYYRIEHFCGKNEEVKCSELFPVMPDLISRCNFI
jgi:hypothetical protein